MQYSGGFPVTAFTRVMALVICVLAAGAFQLSDSLLNAVTKEYGDKARLRLLYWERLLNLPQTLSDQDKLDKVNRFFNRARFVSDIEHWGRADYWATPVEFLSTNGGDCEDFALAKYFTLRQLGVADEKLRVTYVKALTLNQAHMVLAYYPTPGAEPLILDNLIPEIKPAGERKDLYPIYSFNGSGLWLARQKTQGSPVSTPERLNEWVFFRKRLASQLQNSSLSLPF
ncbi:transglutaminase-like cysteine peptidase [Hahella sp. SMD15-11]|uniref:Transglutaminase-like cysteine peptidase n=1 Tax=Thermohahella caldifontis TaxID=3142973 RepID=A0AB39UY74_9GAMM